MHTGISSSWFWLKFLPSGLLLQFNGASQFNEMHMSSFFFLLLLTQYLEFDPISCSGILGEESSWHTLSSLRSHTPLSPCRPPGDAPGYSSHMQRHIDTDISPANKKEPTYTFIQMLCYLNWPNFELTSEFLLYSSQCLSSGGLPLGAIKAETPRPHGEWHIRTLNLKTSRRHAAGLISLCCIDQPTPNSDQKIPAVSSRLVPEASASWEEDENNDAASSVFQRNSAGCKRAGSPQGCLWGRSLRALFNLCPLFCVKCVCAIEAFVQQIQ